MAEQPVSDDEVILRHIPGGTTWQAPGPRITSKNFELRPGEAGVSVSRMSLTSADQLMTRLGNPAAGSRIAAAGVSAVRSLGLDVVPDPIPEDPGHSLIVPAANQLDQPIRKRLAGLFQFVS